ncbi:MAG: hypothetical protein A3A13_04480 [Candidatus Yanofskybacteria bacterium RIFCSPLOWO2_01_FULL_43_22]|uniref:Uncharacterized protein n=1 Tax=Candidatus Yanofskybacteria bacterium RIFCSPLOWO2_01_FULL_43_22 TaxID=1802695 RepID=A0A1F8GD93_9BACT|nr:MAG: hypothetical protein A3A13_04480 [Candidatus Yanofskybacteria bacterium RIFCSPLOWO2_01_FULL_43_22]
MILLSQDMCHARTCSLVPESRGVVCKRLDEHVPAWLLLRSDGKGWLLTLCSDAPEGGGEGEEFRRILAETGQRAEI